jgi:hypothetical protein
MVTTVAHCLFFLMTTRKISTARMFEPTRANQNAAVCENVPLCNISFKFCYRQQGSRFRRKENTAAQCAEH